MTSVENPLEQLDLAHLRQRTSLKWRTYPSDVLPLWVAEMDTRLAEPVAAVLTTAIGRGDTGYPAGTAYAEALRDFAATRWGWGGLAVERTSLVADVMVGIVEILKLLTRPGDAVVVNCPVYPPFYSFVEHLGRRVIEAPLGPTFRLDSEALSAAFAEARREGHPAAYLLCNPHNPTGTVHTAEELQTVAALAEQHGVRVVVDEIHAPLVLAGASFTPYLSVPGAESAFSLMSASKGWNLAGLKAAVAIAGPTAGELDQLPEEVSHGPSHLGALAHTAAYASGSQWLDALLAGLARNRALLGDLLAEHLPAVGYQPPAATYLAWLDCRELGFPGAADPDAGQDLDGGPAADAGRGNVRSLEGPAGFFLDHARVALSAGPAFGSGGGGHVRLNFATSPAILTEAVHRMAAALPAPQKSGS